MNTTLTNEDRLKLQNAQALQIRRERHMEKLAALPMSKAELTPFPYETLDEALDAGFADELMRLARKAWKTEQWRTKAEVNRKERDRLAELDSTKSVEDVVTDVLQELVHG